MQSAPLADNAACSKNSRMKLLLTATVSTLLLAPSQCFCSPGRKRSRMRQRTPYKTQNPFITSRNNLRWSGITGIASISSTTVPTTSDDNDDFDLQAIINSKSAHELDSISEKLTQRILQAQQNQIGASTHRRSDSTALVMDGLTKVHRNILGQTQARQRFVTGKDPLLITVTENPTKKWLLQRNTAASSTIQLLVNGTIIDQSLASFSRFQWLDDVDRVELVEQHSMLSLELLGEIHVRKPGYVNILPTNAAGSSAVVQRTATASKGWERWKTSKLYEKIVLDELGQKEAGRSSDRLWITGFSLRPGQHGQLHSMDVENGYLETVNERTSKSIRWPNESNYVPNSLFGGDQNQYYDDALLVSDGFLVPGKDKGGLYIVQNPGNKESEWNVCLTGGLRPENPEDYGWFYHRSVWLDLTGDGRKSILSARAKLSRASNSDSNAITQLVWLEMPKPSSIDHATNTPLEDDGTVFDPFSSRHLPWKTRVLAEGPDVMFSVGDMDTKDETVEVFASCFFDRKVTMYSIQIGTTPRVVLERTIDRNCGAAFSSVLANLDVSHSSGTHRVVVNSGSTVETLKAGDSFSHILVTSHECSYNEGSDESVINGGSLFAYRVPCGEHAWKTEPWTRTTVASDFTVKGQLNNMINPGAPGFCYTFHAKKEPPGGKRPLIAVAGDCAESAYILRPVERSNVEDPSAQYKLMCEIECGATVGSVGIGYENFVQEQQEEGYAKLYIPCYEKDKVLVFAMGSGEEEYNDDHTDHW